MRRLLPAVAWDHPVSVLMAFLALLVLGILGYARIPLQMMPSGFEPRYLSVWIPYRDASPTETDERVVRPVEEQLATVPGLRKLSSRAGSENASFDLEFHPAVDMATAYADTVDRIERAMPSLPEEVDRYWVWKYNPTDEPVLWTGITFPKEVDDPRRLIDELVVPALDRIPGVASVDVWGADSKRLLVEYDRERLMAHGVDIGDVQRRLATDNFQSSGGRVVEQGEVRHVRNLAKLTHPDDFVRYPVRDGLVLGDIATVRLGFVADADVNRINGQDAAAIGVRKESSANTVEVTAAVVEALRELEADPRLRGARFHNFFDQGELISSGVRTLRDATLLGGLLSVVILWAFLREWRTTLLISLSIPFSLLITVAVMHFTGGTLNLVAMMGLLLGVGMVVDNAIVVIEAIHRRRAVGEDAREAAVGGTGEVGLAITASTATTMVVFLPVMLMSGDADAGFFMRELGTPVVVSLAASLLVALVFAPLATRVVGTGGPVAEPAWMHRLTAFYERVLDRVLSRPADTVVATLAGLVLTVAIAVPGVKCTGGGKHGNLNDFAVRIELPADATPSERDRIARAFEEWVEAHAEEWGVRVYRVQIRDRSSRGRLFVYLRDDAPMTREEVVAAATKSLPRDIPGVKASVGWDGQGANERQIQLSIYGEDVGVLSTLAEEVVRRVRGVEGVLGADLGNVSDGLDEIVLRPDPDALRRYGVSARQLGETVAFAMRGNALEPLGEGADALDVETRVALEDRSDIGTLLDFPIFSPATLGLVPVRALASVEYARAPGNVQREDRRTSETVVLDLAQGVTRADVLPAVEAALEDMVLPRGYTWDASSWLREQGEEDAALVFALGMSVVFVFLLMGVLFESWILPLAIVTTVPMALVGAYWSLFLTRTGMDMMAGIGLVVLVGVVVNNGIVLVDAITQLRHEGLERAVAIREACKRRLRPILMTALTTIIGLLPMAAGSDDFVGIPYAPLGRTVIGGLTAATLLTLLLVPFLYVLLDDLRGWAARAWRTMWV